MYFSFYTCPHTDVMCAISMLVVNVMKILLGFCCVGVCVVVFVSNSLPNGSKCDEDLESRPLDDLPKSTVFEC